MTREYGEKSYNPGTFRMDYWGSGDNSAFWALFKRKLPGNIVLAAYNAPVTMQELSMELGVAVPYLEDEVEILQRHEILKKTGDKYQTDIVIFTDECEKEVTAKIKPLYESAAEKLHTKLKAILPELKKLEFQGQNYDDKTLLWVFANLTNVHALNMADKKQCERFGEYPQLCNGSSGFVFGYDHDYQNHHFNGIYGRCENEENTAYFTVINYRIIEKIQWWEPAAWYISVKAMTDAVLQKPADEDNDMLVRLIGEGFIKCEDGKTRANFPVFPEDVFEGDLRRLLQPLADDVCACMLEACDIAAAVLKKHAPKQLHAKCDRLAAVHYQMDIMAFIVETMVQKGMLAMPKGDAKPCVFGVKK